MRRNRLGRTELNVSVLGLGGHEYRWLHTGNIRDSRQIRYNPERVELVNTALERGLNYFDTTFLEEVQSLGHVLNQIGRRDDIIVNGMVIDVLERAEEMTYGEMDSFIQSELETRIELLGSPFDTFMLGAIEGGYDPCRAQRVVEIYQRHREAGAFRFIGVSCHSYSVLVNFLQLDVPVDVVMFPFNYAQSILHESELEEVFRLIEENDLGAVAMKPLCWTMYFIPFTCINPEGHDIQTLIRHSFAWQASQKAIHTSVVGVETLDEMASCMQGVGMSYDERFLAPYIEARDSLELLVRGGLQHSEEIQSQVVNLLRLELDHDCGPDLRDYIGKTG